MRVLSLALVLVLFLPFTASKADVQTLSQAPQIPAAAVVLNDQNSQTTQSPGSIELQKIIVKKPFIHKRRILLPIDSIAEAASLQGPVAEVLNPLPVDSRPVDSRSPGLISSISPGYTLHRGFLNLSKVTYNRRKEAFMFVFLMNKPKPDPYQTAVSMDKPRGRMHISGTKKIFKDQRLIEHEYPLDVSVARYEDGLAENEWNLILPSKKPREVKVSLMWSF